MPLAAHLVNVVEDLLRSADREGWNNQISVSQRCFQYVEKLVTGLAEFRVKAIPICGFYNNIVGLADRHRLPDEWPTRLAEIATEHDLALVPTLTDTTSMIAEPRMWPASRNVADIPPAGLCGVS